MADVQTLPAIPPLTEDQVTAWRERVKAGQEPVKKIIEQGKINVSRYQGKHLTEKPTDDTVVVPIDYSYTEQKKAQLFFQTPEIQAEPLRPDYTAAPLMTAVINQALSPDGVNAKAMMFEVLPDIICATGYGVTKIGYENVTDGTRPVELSPAVTDPQTGIELQPAQTGEAPNIISETYYWRRIPPGFFSAPRDFRGSDFDDASWLAWRFSEDVPDGGTETSGKDTDDLLLVDPVDAGGQSKAPKRWGWEVWYKASRFDPSVKHPDITRTFKLYDDEPVARDHRDSPFQKWAVPGQAQLSPTYVPGGQLIGMRGFPLHVGTLQYVPDRPFPPSYSTMSRQQVDELSKGRTQMVQRRDRSMPQVGYDATRVLPDSLNKIQRNINTSFVGFTGPIDDSMMKAIEKGNYGREQFTFNDYIKADIDTIWAMGANAGLQQSDKTQTATETNVIQSSVETRAEADRTRILEFFVKGVAKLAALKQLFADEQDYVPIVGQDGAKQLVAWDKTQIAGRYLFTAKPDSHVRIDAAQDRQQKLNAYNQLRKDPEVQARELIVPVLQAIGVDPQKGYKPPQPPQEEKPNVSWAIKMEDFYGPAAAIAAQLAKAKGIVIPPEMLATVGTLGALYAAQQAAQDAAQAAQKQQGGQPAPHGGAADTTEPINKHANQITGGTPGIGVM